MTKSNGDDHFQSAMGMGGKYCITDERVGFGAYGILEIQSRDQAICERMIPHRNA